MNDVEERKTRLPEKIALCMSGGGYRAAGFHLGTLDYLEHLGLLSKLAILSTVSGGTFVGTAYTISLVEKDPFSKFFDDCYTFFRDQVYIKNILPFLGTERPDQPGRRRNMIQAAAELYATTFLRNEKTGKPYLFGTILDSDIPLVPIFNATCFWCGESFVFQKGQTAAGRVGTLQTHLSDGDARNIRLADITAASSCFPGGFEPLAFPHDFVWPGEVPALQQYHLFPTAHRFTPEKIPETIPLMDGGVADNVGLTTLLLAIEQGEDDPDLIIASDVDRKLFDLYEDFPLKDKATSFLQKISRTATTIHSLHRYLVAVVVFLALTMIGQGVYTWQQFEQEGFQWSSLFFYLVALLLSIAVGGGILWARRLFRNGLLGWFDDKMAEGEGRAWNIFKNLTLGHAVNMIKLRVSSVFAMTSNVFMRCISELTYTMFRENPDYSSRFIEDRISFVKNIDRNPYIKQSLPCEPSDGLLKVIDAIADMDSTLWWQKKYQLPCLLACGQISLCLSLFMHYYNPEETDPEILELLGRLSEDWRLLNENPFHFLEERYPHLKPFPLPPGVRP